MTERMMPRYPVYIPTKGRADTCLTAKCLVADGVPFKLVVEPQEREVYEARFGADHILELPFSNLGSVIPARNWIKAHATASGAERHWQIDDNIRHFGRRYGAKRLKVEAGIALRVAEDFTDRYENIGVSGLNYYMFVPDRARIQPIQINCHVYSCTLTLNALPFEWRGPYNEDTDYCLQVLSTGYWCTVLLNAFLVQKLKTMMVKGGNTQELYQADGRLRMARSLEQRWPGVVTVERRFNRPQHVVKNAWKLFDTPLRLKPGIDLSTLKANEFGMELVQVADEIKSVRVRETLATWQRDHSKTVMDEKVALTETPPNLDEDLLPEDLFS